MVAEASEMRAPGAASGLDRWARRAVWALVTYGVLLAISTLTHQPDPATEFPDYARYVTTPRFLASHLGASVAGAGIGLVGAVGLFVVAHPWSPRRATVGLVSWVLAQVALASVFGVAAFAQPAIGRTFLAGAEEVARAVDAEVYAAPLFATAAVGLLLLGVGTVLLALASLRVPGVPRWAGHTLWIGTLVFALSGFTVPVVQPFGGLVIAASAAVIAGALTIGHRSDGKRLTSAL